MKSIKAKLIMLGAVAIICTVILGLVGIYIMNSNNASNQVLGDINNINLKQNENTTQETSFLYDLDLSHYQTIQSNLAYMNEAAADALTYSGGESYNADLQSVASTIESVAANTVELDRLLGERGFQSSTGMYASYAGGDENLFSAITQMSGEAAWVDGVWDSAALASIPSELVGGKNLKKASYAHEMPDISKRNTLMIRLGGNGLEYTGDVYVTNIKLDATEISITDINPDVLSGSYGDGLANVEIGSVDGKDALYIQTKFTNVNESWQEVTAKIDVSGINISEYKNISFDLYFEDKGLPEISVATAFDGKYEFETELKKINTMFDEYNKLVAEGSDTGSYPDDMVALLNTLTANAPLYTKDQGIADTLSAGFGAKLSAVEGIVAYDKDILSLKAQNNTLNANLTEETTAVRSRIEELTNQQKVTMSSLIYGVFAVGAVLVVILTLFVIASVQKSIKKFDGTLSHITEGEIMIKADTNDGNEFDVFGRSLNKMTDKLSQVIGNVKEYGIELQRSGAELAEMSRSSERRRAILTPRYRISR